MILETGDYDKYLKVHGIFNKIRYYFIVREARKMNEAYRTKYPNFTIRINFFEVLHLYLVGCGFSGKKIASYLKLVADNMTCDYKQTNIDGNV